MGLQPASGPPSIFEYGVEHRSVYLQVVLHAAGIILALALGAGALPQCLRGPHYRAIASRLKHCLSCASASLRCAALYGIWKLLAEFQASSWSRGHQLSWAAGIT
jgi:hypothetical protein